MYFLSSGCWKSKIKLLAGWISPKASLLGLEMPVSSLGPHAAFPLRVHFPGVSASSHEDTSHMGLVPNP